MSEWAIIGIVVGGIILALEVVYPIWWVAARSLEERRRKKHGEAER